MKKKTDRYTKELGKTRRQLKREEHIKDLRKDPTRDYPKHRHNGNGLKKNMRKLQPISFQVASQHRLKFCKRIPLTDELRMLLGRGIMKIIPREVKERAEMLPYVSVYRDTKNYKLILSIDSVSYEDDIVQAADGSMEFQPCLDYSQARFKHNVNYNTQNTELCKHTKMQFIDFSYQ